MTREPEFSITKNDLRIRWFSGTGAGGQHRNKHQNCCEITHEETGISAVGQGSRSREQNKREAFRTLAQRLLPYIRARLFGEGDSGSDRRGVHAAGPVIVRTYSEPRNQVVDRFSGCRESYSTVVEKGDLGGMIEARRIAHINRTEREDHAG